MDAMMAARAGGLELADFNAQIAAARRVAEPDAPHPAVFALRQSVKETA